MMRLMELWHMSYGYYAHQSLTRAAIDRGDGSVLLIATAEYWPSLQLGSKEQVKKCARACGMHLGCVAHHVDRTCVRGGELGRVQS